MDNPPNIQITAFGKTDVGLIREHNEDNLLIADVSRGLRVREAGEPLKIELGAKGALFLVCDGMGGAAAGEVASQMAVESITGTLEGAAPLDRDPFARRLRHAIEDANDRIFAQSRDNQSERGMGTTCTAVALVDGTLVVGQIGDSRAYVMRGGRLAQVTKDQSLAWQLMEAGAMTAEEAKGFEHANIILQALGVQERVEVVMSQVELRRGDVILVSSDGLHGPVTDDEILQILQDEQDLKKACDRLVTRALEREGPDNITVVVAKVEGPGLPDPKPADMVEFVPYDPGYDHSDPPRVRSDMGEKVTVEVTVPKEAIRLTGGHDPTALPGSSARGAAAAAANRSETSAVLSFLLVTLLAATAAGVFVKCDRSRALEQESQTAAALRASSQNESPPPTTEPAAAPTPGSEGTGEEGPPAATPPAETPAAAKPPAAPPPPAPAAPEPAPTPPPAKKRRQAVPPKEVPASAAAEATPEKEKPEKPAKAKATLAAPVKEKAAPAAPPQEKAAQTPAPAPVKEKAAPAPPKEAAPAPAPAPAPAAAKEGATPPPAKEASPPPPAAQGKQDKKEP